MTALAKTWRALCHGPGCRRQQHRSPACLSSGAHHNAQPDKLQHRRITVVSGRAGAAVSSVVVDVEVVLSEEQQRQQLQQPSFCCHVVVVGSNKSAYSFALSICLATCAVQSMADTASLPQRSQQRHSTEDNTATASL